MKLITLRWDLGFSRKLNNYLLNSVSINLWFTESLQKLVKYISQRLLPEAEIITVGDPVTISKLCQKATVSSIRVTGIKEICHVVEVSAEHWWSGSAGSGCKCWEEDGRWGCSLWDKIWAFLENSRTTSWIPCFDNIVSSYYIQNIAKYEEIGNFY